MNIIITRDMPYLELYQGDTLPLKGMIMGLSGPSELIATCQGKIYEFPPTCAEIDYRKQIDTLKERMETIDTVKMLLNETEDNISNLEL